MTTIEGKKREILGKKVKILSGQGILPAVLYGPEIKSMPLQVNSIEFNKLYEKEGESSLITLKVASKEYPVLVHDIKRDPLTSNITHIDFYQPILTEEVEASVPVVFIGESLAVKDLGGTLLKEVQELEVKALPQDLPHQITVDISVLNTFEDEILIKDLVLPPNVKLIKNPQDLVAVVTPPQKVEEELEKPIEEKVDEVGKSEEKKPTEDETVAEEPKGKKE
jgi:large subunit ribosomal protein L25